MLSNKTMSIDEDVMYKFLCTFPETQKVVLKPKNIMTTL